MTNKDFCILEKTNHDTRDERTFIISHKTDIIHHNKIRTVRGKLLLLTIKCYFIITTMKSLQNYKNFKWNSFISNLISVISLVIFIKSIYK